MIIANRIHGGDCPECGATQSLEVSVIREDNVVYGCVSCIECGEWITDLVDDELIDLGINLSGSD
jgi:Zn ribbon nucleic-acid-binding protein